jgi:hypothetical protein
MRGHYWFTYTELDIEEFLKFYRSQFPKDTYPKATILPKFHLLEDHMVDWLKRFHLGAGLMGEQGAESIHAHLNRLEKTYANIPNSVDRLRYIFNMYGIETAPSLQTLKPAIKTRKRKRPDD